jgi:CrcB protein
MKLFYIAAGGAIGALFRYFVSGAVHTLFAGMYPLGTLVVNVTGSFAIGFLWYLSEEVIVPQHIKTFAFIGILGGFTTFSTYMLETLNLLREGEFNLAILNCVLNNFIGFGLVIFGFVLSQYFLNLIK